MEDDDQVRDQGGWKRVEGGLWYGGTVQRGRGRNRGVHPCNDDLVGAVCQGGGLGTLVMHSIRTIRRQ